MRIIFLGLVYPLQYPLVGFIQGFGQFVKILAEVWGEAILQRVQLAEYPSEPVQQRKELPPAWDSMTLSHSVCSFRQRLDHQILIVRPPSPHRRARGRVDNVSNVVLDVLFLSAFIVQGNGTECQRFDDSSDVDLRATGRTNVKFWQVKVDEFLHELKDLAARRWDPGRCWTFVERVQDNEYGGLSW